MLCAPTASVAIAHCACTPVIATPVQVAMFVTPSLNVAVPVGPWPLMVTVKVTFCPNWLGLADDTSRPVVGALLTTRLNGADVFGELLTLPAYVTVIGWLPTASA